MEIDSNTTSFADPNLLLLLQAMLQTTQPNVPQEEIEQSNNSQLQPLSIDQIVQQANLLQMLQEMVAKSNPPQQATESIEEEQFDEEPSDQNTLQEQQSTGQAHSNFPSSDNQEKRETVSTMSSNLPSEYPKQLTQSEQTNLQILPSLASQISAADRIAHLNQINEQQTQEIQLLNFLQSYLALEQIVQTALAAGVQPQAHNNMGNEDNHHLANLSHLFATPTGHQFDKKENLTSSTQCIPSASKQNKACPSFMQGINTNLKSYFDMNSDDKQNKLSPTSSVQKQTLDFAPTMCTSNFYGEYGAFDPSLLTFQQILDSGLSMQELMRLREQKRLERQFKIERYKNKRRNWIRKISYDCRKRVADSRLRIKGRFISKKDSEKIKHVDEFSNPIDFTESRCSNEPQKKRNTFNSKKDLIVQRGTHTNNIPLQKQGNEDGGSNSNLFSQTFSKSFQAINLHPEAMAKVKQRIIQKRPLFSLKVSYPRSDLSRTTSSSESQLCDEKGGSAGLSLSNQLLQQARLSA